MIYDPHLGLIFIKTLKVSGSSFEAALAPFLSRVAIATINESWTSNGKRVDAIDRRRTNWLPLRRLIPQVLRHRHEARHIPIDLLRGRGPRHEAFSLHKDHMSAEEIRAFVGIDEWNRCTKVEIGRNPYERLVSYYFMKKRQYPRPEKFPAFIDWLIANPEVILKNERLVSVTDADGISRADVDFVIYYEDMDEGLVTFAERFGLDADRLIERYRSIKIHDGYRPRGFEGSAAHVIDDKSKALIDTLLKMRFDRLGYVQAIDNVVPLGNRSMMRAGAVEVRAVS